MSQNSFTNTIYLLQADVKSNRELIKHISHVENIFLRKCYGCVVISHDDNSDTHVINLHISECVLMIPGRVLKCFELYNCFVISGCVSIFISIWWFLAVFWVFYKCFNSTRYFMASSIVLYFCALAGSFCMSKFVAYIFLANWPGIIEKCSLKREVVFSDNDLALWRHTCLNTAATSESRWLYWGRAVGVCSLCRVFSFFLLSTMQVSQLKLNC